MSKNDQPFLVQRWSVDGWTDGWTTAKPYEINSSYFWFLLKASGYANDGNNVHIMKVSHCGNPTKRFTHRWGENWTTAEFYQAKNGKTFLFLMKASGKGDDGFNVHIHEVNASGDIGEQVFEKDWSPGWTNAQFFEAGVRRFLFLYKARGAGEDGHNVHVHEVLDNGDIGSKVFFTDFFHNPQSFETVRSTVTYRIGRKTFLLVIRESGVDPKDNVHIPSDGNLHIFELTMTGGFGSSIETLQTSAGWTSVRVFEARGRKYLFLLKKNEGRVNIHKINLNGTLGELVCAYDRKPSYTEAFGTGSLAPEGGPIPWTTGWTNVEFLSSSSGETLLFAIKQKLTPNKKKRAKICQVHAMSSVGPMVGMVSATKASIWVGSVGHERPTATIRCRLTGGPAATEIVADFVFLAGRHYYNPGTASLKELWPNAEYTYEVELNSKPFGGGRFRTAPGDRPGVFTLAAASCIDLSGPHYRHQEAWRHLLSMRPDLLILGGDISYPNTTMRSMIWAEHLQTRGLDGFDEVIANTPTFVTWDDHDFGPNNSGGGDVEILHRDESLKAFKELFPGDPFFANEGLYYKFRWQDVDFFMLDVRFFRTHYETGNPANRDMLGPNQWLFLRADLAASNAPFKVLVSGTTLDSGDTETWADDYPMEWTRLRTLAAQHSGVVVISGDVHRCEVRSHPIADKLLWEFTSSGIGQNIGEPCHEKDGFMTLTFDTTSADPSITVRTFSKSGLEISAPQTIKRSMTT